MAHKSLATYNFGSRFKKRVKRNEFRIQSRHYTDVKDRVRKYLFENASEYVLFKEEIAKELKVKVDEIEQALQQLNIEGMVSQPEHRIHEDGWTADRYYPRVKDYMVKYLQAGTQDDLREEIIEAVLNSSNALIEHILRNCKGELLSKHERELMLIKLRDNGAYSYRFFEEYEGKDKAKAMVAILKDTSSCINLLLHNSDLLTSSERKKLFNVIFIDGFHTHLLVKNDRLNKKEKELVVQKALDESNFYLLDMIEQCTNVKINKNLQGKVDAFLTMQTLINNQDRFNPNEPDRK